MSEEKRKFVSRYTRPIGFVSSTSSDEPLDKTKKKQKVRHSNGDQVASLYRSIITPSPSTTASPSPLPKPNNNTPSDTWYCEHCDMHILKKDYKRHISGTAHMVVTNSTAPPPADILTLNGSNIGFKMLQSQGWQYEHGLGASNQGRRHPIATVLKQDRLGVGHQETSKKAITHTYKDIEKKAIQRHLATLHKKKDPGREMAQKAKAESKDRVALLSYLKN